MVIALWSLSFGTIISALALAALAFSGMAAAEQLYVNESDWWRGGCTFNESGAPISAAVGAAAADSIYVEGGRCDENVDVDKPRLTLVKFGYRVCDRLTDRRIATTTIPVI